MLKKFAWTSIRSLGNSWPARLSILVPFFGNILIFNKLFLDFAGVGTSCSLPLGPTCLISQTTIYNYYLGLCLIGVASGMYQIFCPPIIKKYIDEDFFVIEHSSLATRPQLTRYLEFITNNKTDRRYKFILSTLVNGSIDTLNKEVIRDILREYYFELNQKGNFWLYCCVLFYAFGSTFLIWPTLTTFFTLLTEYHLAEL